MIEEAEADIRRLEEMAAQNSLSEGYSAELFLLTERQPTD